MPAARVLLLVDNSYQVYRAAAAHPMLTSRRVFTGGLYGFWTTLAKTIRETQATHIAFCQDIKPYRRSETYPEYKQLRKQRADEDLLRAYKQSLKLVEESIEAAGLQAWGVPGFESDDLVAHCVMKYRHRFDRIYAASNDSDLWQLLWCDNFYIWRKSKADVVGGATLHDAFGKPITPAEYMLLTAITGTHNDVAGIPGVGPVTALKALRDPATMRKLRDGHGDVIDRNLALISLPHKDFPRGASLPASHGVDPRSLYRYLGGHDIEVTGALASALDQLRDNR